MRQPSVSFFFSCHNSLLQFCETRPHFKVLLRTELSKICISNGRGGWKWSCWKINVNSITKHCDRSWTFNLLLFVNVVKLLMSKEQDSMLFCLMLVKIKWERLNLINVNSITKLLWSESWTFSLWQWQWPHSYQLLVVEGNLLWSSACDWWWAAWNQFRV